MRACGSIRRSNFLSRTCRVHRWAKMLVLNLYALLILLFAMAFVRKTELTIIDAGIATEKRQYDVLYDASRGAGNEHYVICDLCTKHIGSTVNGSVTNFGQHRGTKECGKNKRRIARHLRQGKALEGYGSPVRFLQIRCETKLIFVSRLYPPLHPPHPMPRALKLKYLLVHLLPQLLSVLEQPHLPLLHMPVVSPLLPLLRAVVSRLATIRSQMRRQSQPMMRPPMHFLRQSLRVRWMRLLVTSFWISATR